jgi:hypothetical protein
MNTDKSMVGIVIIDRIVDLVAGVDLYTDTRA